MEHDFTRGNILKTIAVFALPYMLSYFLQMLYGMADLYMMGQFSGAAGITAVGNGAQTLYIITVTLVGLVEKMISFCSLCRVPRAPPSAHSRHKTPAQARAIAHARCSGAP